MRAPNPRRWRLAVTEVWPALAVGVALIAAWSWGSQAADSLPSPLETLEALGDMAGSGQLFLIAAKVFAFMAVTSALSAAVGVPWGIASGSWRWLDRATSPYLSAMRALPSGMWIPVAAVLVGGSIGAMGAVVILGALPAMVLATKQAVGTIPPLLLRAGRTFGAGKQDLMRRVVLPAALPGIVDGVELGWAMGFRALVAGEIFFGAIGGTGIGAVIAGSRESGDLAPMLATIAVILAVGIAMDRLVFGAVHHRMRRSRGLVDTV